MKNYLNPGHAIDCAAPYAVGAGEGVLIGQLFGIACADAENGADVTIQTDGVFTIAKQSADVFAVGGACYFDTATKTVRSGGDTDSNSAGDSEAMVGVCVKAAGAGETSVRVKLAPSPVALV